MKINKIRKVTLSAVFIALGIVLPMFTSQIKEIGDSLLPMHLVIMLCGLLCGWKYGLASGLILPFLRSLLFHMPPIYPNAVWMALELATYGFVLGLLYNKFSNKKTYSLLICLLISMISGRIVWGITKAVLLGIASKPFTFEMFIVGGFIDAIPGIIIQFIIIPIVMNILKRIN